MQPGKYDEHVEKQQEYLHDLDLKSICIAEKCIKNVNKSCVWRDTQTRPIYSVVQIMVYDPILQRLLDQF